MSVSCQILLQKTEEGVFRPGQPVAGTVKYSIDKPTKFGSIDLHFVGNGHCEWSEKDSDDKTIYYENKEEYVKQYINLFIVREDQNILLGNFEHSFEFLLPDDLPTSIKNSSCTIEYKVILTFVKENLYETEYEFVEEIPVYGYVSPRSPGPHIFGLQKDVFSLRSKNNIINVKAEMEKTFFTPGENITLGITINNDSDVSVTIKAELYKYFTYVAEGDQTYIERESLKTTKSYSPSIKERSVSKFNFIVPTLPSLYSIQHSKILIGEYKVRVTAKVPFPHINASAEVPVVIGERRDHLGVKTVGIGDENEEKVSSKNNAEDEININGEVKDSEEVK